MSEQYANDVLSGKIVAGRLIKLACERFLKDLQRDDIIFDERDANKFINFAQNHLNQWEGDWQGMSVKFDLWQVFIFQQLFGWIRKDTGTRRFTKFYLQVSKKNGKSSMCAWLALFHLFADEKIKTPKIFTAANNEDQAKLCVNISGRTIEWSPDLNTLVESNEVKLSTYGSNITEVIHKTRDGFIKALSKEGGDKKAKTSGGKHGINASLGLVDEFGMSPDHGASGSISTSMASRKERLMAYLTTAGFNMGGPCYSELRDQGIKVLEGVIEMDNYLPIIYELDPPIEDGKPQEITLQWLLANEQEWYKSNPNLDVSVNREYLREMLQNAISLGGTTEIEVMTLNFNRWMNSVEVFIPSEVWDRNAHGYNETDLEGAKCYGGIELVGAKGMSSFCLLFPGENITAVKMFFWGPQAYFDNNVDRFDKLSSWAKYIKVDAGNTVENQWVIDWLTEEIAKYNFQSFAFSKLKENDDIVQGLLKNDIEGNPISQAIGGISNPTSQWEDLLHASKIEHFNNPVLKWMNGNCNVIRKEAGIRIEKKGSRVVGISAAINALAQWKTMDGNEEEAGFEMLNL